MKSVSIHFSTGFIFNPKSMIMKSMLMDFMIRNFMIIDFMILNSMLMDMIYEFHMDLHGTATKSSWYQILKKIKERIQNLGNDGLMKSWVDPISSRSSPFSPTKQPRNNSCLTIGWAGPTASGWGFPAVCYLYNKVRHPASHWNCTSSHQRLLPETSREQSSHLEPYLKKMKGDGTNNTNSIFPEKDGKQNKKQFT